MGLTKNLYILVECVFHQSPAISCSIHVPRAFVVQQDITMKKNLEEFKNSHTDTIVSDGVIIDPSDSETAKFTVIFVGQVDNLA